MSRLRALCGVVGPAAFTVAWVAGQRRQDRYAVAHEHISGLAARDATDPHLMTAGFLALGACTVAFAYELDRQLGGGRRAGWGPALIGAAGLTTIAAGIFRRDRRSNLPAPNEPAGQSWANDAHDAAAVAGGVAGTVGMLALARRFHGDPQWRALAGPALRTTVVSAGASAWFASDVVRPGNGLVQRAGVSLPLGFMMRLAVRLLRRAAI